MVPKKTKDLYKQLAEEQNLSETACSGCSRILL
jgi:hypothetical protein